MTSPDLPLYTADTRAMLTAAPLTAEVMADELVRLKKHMPAAIVYLEGKRAVIRFAINEKKFPPFFLVAGEFGWELDLAARQQLTERTEAGGWRFRTLDHPYMFAYKRVHFSDDLVLQ
jgi:hypothetical protein